MARRRKTKEPTYTPAMIALLEHADGQIAGTVMPLPEGGDMPAAVEALAALGLLTTAGREPALTPAGHNVCGALAARGWRWPAPRSR